MILRTVPAGRPFLRSHCRRSGVSAFSGRRFRQPLHRKIPYGLLQWKTRRDRHHGAPGELDEENFRQRETSSSCQRIDSFAVEKLSCILKTGKNVLFRQTRVTLKNLRMTPPESQQIHNEFHRDPGRGSQACRPEPSDRLRFCFSVPRPYYLSDPGRIFRSSASFRAACSSRSAPYRADKALAALASRYRSRLSTIARRASIGPPHPSIRVSLPSSSL
jgi:hypothetical protein